MSRDFISITKNGDLADILHLKVGVMQNAISNCNNFLKIKTLFFTKLSKKLKSVMTNYKLHCEIFFFWPETFSSAKSSPVAGFTLHTASCTLHTTHCTCICTCTCTLHTTKWTLHTAHQVFILHVAHLSLHSAHSQKLLEFEVKLEVAKITLI